MTPAMLLAMLLQSGICSQTEFKGADGASLTVVVCPILIPPGGAGEEAKPEELPNLPPAHGPKQRT